MSAFVDKVGIWRPGLGNAAMLLPSISFNRAGPQHIILLGSSNRNSPLWTFTISVPQLSYRVASRFSLRINLHLAITKQA